MPVVLQLRFPGRRYHATPWGKAVNEAAVEWPPSPWRLLRAMIATGYGTLHWPAERPPELAVRLIERLASTLPSYALPPASLAHSRHYMPTTERKQSLVIDAWAQVEDGHIEVVWEVELEAAERDLLAQIAERLAYLGRAESWVEARLVPKPSSTVNCTPTPAPGTVEGGEAVQLLAPQADSDFAAWRDARIAAVQSQFTEAKLSRVREKERTKLLNPIPRDLWACLCAESAALAAEGWSRPPGSRSVSYTRAANALTVAPPPARSDRRAPAHPFMLLAVSTDSRNSSALPPVSRTWPQGRLLHRALAAQVGRMGGAPQLAARLLGRTSRDAPPERGNRHAHLLHVDLDGDGRLDHVLVWAPAGLDADAQAAIGALRATYMKGGAGELQIAVAAHGDAATLRGMRPPYGPALTSVLGERSGATTWISATPFFPGRHPKRPGVDGITDVVQTELRNRGLPTAGVQIVDLASDRAFERFRHFVRRDDRHAPILDAPLALKLTFEAPVCGPIVLGWGCHQGLGRFEAVF